MKKSSILITIIVVIVSIVFVFLFGVASFIFMDINSGTYQPLSNDNYSRNILQFVQNEQKSSSINDDVENGLSTSELVKKLNTETIPIWKENRILMEVLINQDDLTESQKKEAGKLLKYSELKIELYEVLKEGISENNGEHLPIIDSLNLEIEAVLKI